MNTPIVYVDVEDSTRWTITYVDITDVSLTEEPIDEEELPT